MKRSLGEEEFAVVIILLAPLNDPSPSSVSLAFALLCSDWHLLAHAWAAIATSGRCCLQEGAEEKAHKWALLETVNIAHFAVCQTSAAKHEERGDLR